MTRNEFFLAALDIMSRDTTKRLCDQDGTRIPFGYGFAEYVADQAEQITREYFKDDAPHVSCIEAEDV